MADLFDLIKTDGRVAITPQEDGSVKPLVIDATIEENHLLAARVTEFPIEDGSSISDHVIQSPFKLTMNCVISDDPINTSELLESTALGLSSSVFGSKAIIAAGIASKIGGDLLAKNRSKISKTAKETLEGFKKEAILLTVSTSLEVYSNMLIENIGIPRTVRNSSSLSFSIVLKQVDIVSKEFVTVDLSKLASDAQGAADNVNQGRQSTEAANDALQEKGASLLVKLGRSAGIGQ